MAERDVSFTQQIEDCEQAPATWVPALLKGLIRAAVQRDVFIKGGLARYVKLVEAAIRKELGK